MKQLIKALLLVCCMVCGLVWAAAVPDAAAPNSIAVVTDDNYPPYIFRNSDGQLEGYIVDFWKLWEQKTGVRVRLVATTWADAQTRMLAGEFDVIDSIFRTPERLTQYSFTEPYASLPVAIYAHNSIRGIHEAASLRGFEIGVQAGDACIGELRKHNISSVVPLQNNVSLLAAARRGDIKLFCMDEAPANYYLYREGAHHEFIKAFDLYTGQFHRAVRKGDASTLALVERGTAAIGADELAALDRKWTGTPFRWLPYVQIAGVAFGVLLVVGAGLALWVRALRAAVARKTGELETEKANLRDSEERFRTLFEDTVQPIALADESRFIAANRATLSMLHMTHPEQLIGRTPVDISPPVQPDGRPSAEKAMEMIATTLAKGSHAFEWKHLRADGVPIDVQLLLTTLHRDNRRLLHVVWNDVTEQKSNQRELAAYRSELEQRVATRTAELAEMAESLHVANVEQRAIFDATTVGVVFVRERHILRCNRALEASLGYEHGELDGQSMGCLFRKDSDFAAIAQQIQANLALHGAFRTEVEVMRKDGSGIWARLSMQVIEPSSPEKGLVSIIEDITRERDAFNAIADARNMAEEAARVKSDFVANMSHEIRTPMTAILGFTHLLLSSSLPPRQQDYLQKIRMSGEHLLAVINDILDFSKIEAGKMHIEHVAFELDDVLGKVGALIQERCAAKGLAFVVELAPDVPRQLVGDPTRIVQVLVNYVGNAVKFTEHGNITLHVERVPDKGPGVVLKFMVRDTGIGLSDEQRQRLFQSFQQADSSISRKHGGTGLGLVISKRLAELLGGEVGVESRVGQGSTFWFTARLGVGEAQGIASGLQPSTPDLATIAGTEVLLVEDNEINQEVVKEILEDFGVKVTIAENGARAVEMVRNGNYGLVFMDMQMPVMDGLDATREIRKLPGMSALPIVAMTANAMSEDRERCLAAGMNDHLGKPVEPDELLAKLRDWIAHGRNPATG